MIGSVHTICFLVGLLSLDDIAGILQIILRCLIPSIDYIFASLNSCSCYLLFIYFSLQYNPLGGSAGQENTTARCRLFTGGVWADRIHQCKQTCIDHSCDYISWFVILELAFSHLYDSIFSSPAYSKFIIVYFMFVFFHANLSQYCIFY